MSKPVSRSTKTQISDGETASEMTIRSLESELNQTCTDYTRELIDLRERNSALIEHIANLRSRNKELATTEDLVWIQESQIKKMRDSETKLNIEVARLREQFETQKQLLGEDRRSVERLQKTLRAQETELRFASESETVLKNEVETLRAECKTLSKKVMDGEAALTKLEKAFTEQQINTQRAKDEYNRRVAMLVDESWAKDLEIDRLQKAETGLTTQIARLSTEAFAQSKSLKEANEALGRLEKDHAANAAELQDLKNNSERKLNEMLKGHVQQSESLYGARTELNEEIRRLRSESADYRNQLKSANDQISTLRGTISSQSIECQQTRYETERQTALLKTEHTLQMTAKDAAVENVKEACERKIARLGQHFELEVEKFHASEGKLNAQLNQLHAERAVQVRLLKESNSTINELNKLLDENQKERTKLEAQIKRISDDYKRDTEHFHGMEVSLKSDLARLNGELSLNARLLEEQRIIASEVVPLRSAIKELAAQEQLKLEKAKYEIANLMTERTQYLAERQQNAVERESQAQQITEIRNQLAAKAQKISDLEVTKADLAKLHRDYDDQKILVLDLRKQIDQKIEQVENFADEALTLRQLVEDQTKRLEMAKSEVATLKQSVRNGFESRDAMTELERERLEKLTAQLSVREQQLRHYATSLNKEKVELKGFSKQIASEIQMVSKTHPLKDYLKATEFELAKVELQLKTTPTLAPERTKLENAVGQLMEQREFLKAILVSAQAQFEGQVATLEKIVQNVKLAPPPPPSLLASALPPALAAAMPTTQTPTPTAINVQWESPMQDLK